MPQQIDFTCSIIGPYSYQDLFNELNKPKSNLILIIQTTEMPSFDFFIHPNFAPCNDDLGIIPDQYNVKSANKACCQDYSCDQDANLYLIEDLIVEGLDIIAWFADNKDRILDLEYALALRINAKAYKPQPKFTPAFHAVADNYEFDGWGIATTDTDSSGLESEPGFFAKLGCILS